MATILLVEDFGSLRILSAKILREAGHTVFEARDGTEALECVARESSKLDLLITDIKLPDVSGTDLAVHVRQTHPDAHVLFVTGQSPEELAHLSLPDRSDLLAKPFASKELLALVGAILAEPPA